MNIGLSIPVPGNASRFFASQQDAMEAPCGRLQFSIKDGLIFNSLYNPSLVKFDEQYCTSVSKIESNFSLPTLDYFDEILNFLGAHPRVVDIGCGQGELVMELQKRGYKAVGYDPVSRVDSPYISKTFWNPKDSEEADLFVMRCVLPHISEPWLFLDSLFVHHPNAKVLIEYQRIEWAIENGVWYQFNHDHVNQFMLSNFYARFNVLNFGEFANGEWQWVLIGANSSLGKDLSKILFDFEFIATIFNQREKFLENLATEERQVTIWGAAGKGIVLAHAISSVLKSFTVVDADRNRWGLFLESSGKQVLSPAEFVSLNPKDSIVFVCNPNHLPEVRDYLSDNHSTITPFLYLSEE